jgi:cation:H+ antiporter
LAGVGLVLLLVSGDFLVRGAVALSLKSGVSPLIISLTVVAFGTSAPELLIAIEAAMIGAPGIVLGNVVGSNIANVLLVLGTPALIAPLICKDCESSRTYLLMIAISLLFIGMCFVGPLTWWHGAILLACQAAILLDAFRSAKREQAAGAAADLDVDESASNLESWKTFGFLAAGLIGLPIGAHFLIEGARNLALDMGVTEGAIGLTLVAVGTSLPELAATVAAALRRQTSIALGNVIGSNLFNLLTIMGVGSMLGPLTVPEQFLTVDLWVMLAASAALAPFAIWQWSLGRVAGAIFLVLYVAYIYMVLTPNM